jgi:hypothetical protein
MILNALGLRLRQSGLLDFSERVDVFGRAQLVEMVAPMRGWNALCDELQRGALDAEISGPGLYEDEHVDGHRSLLVDLVRRAPLNVIEAVLDRGADPNLGAPIEGAASENRTDVVALLLMRGAKPRGPTALRHAITAGNRELFELLVSHGADVMSRNSEGHSMLSMAQGFAAGPPTKATQAGISERIRDIMLLARTDEPGATLRYVKTRSKVTGAFGPFAKARWARQLNWILFALEGDHEAALEVIGGSARVERDVAKRRVVARAGRYVLRMTSSRWTWFLYAPEILRASTHFADASDEVRRLTAAWPGRVLLFRNMDVEAWVHGRLQHALTFDPAAIADEWRLKSVNAQCNAEALKRMDAFCEGEGLFLPHCHEVGDGLELVLQVENCASDAIERADVVVTW